MDSGAMGPSKGLEAGYKAGLGLVEASRADLSYSQ